MKASISLLAYAAIAPSAVLIFDLLKRFDALSGRDSTDLKLYVFSWFAMYALWIGALAAVAYLWQVKPRAALIGAIAWSAAYAALLVGCYGFHAYFGILPNLFTFEYLYEETADFWVSASDGADGLQVLGIIAGAAAVLVYTSNRWIRKTTVRAPRWLVLTPAVFVLVISPILHNNVRLYPSSFLPEIQTIFSFTKATENSLRDQTKGIKLLHQGSRAPFKARVGKLPFNVLIILNESLRADRLSSFGYERPTTPYLDTFFEQHAESTVRFARAYANATRTMMAVPSFLTGVNPVQSAGLLHSTPLIFDYGKLFNDAPTFIISAHNFEWANLGDFLAGGALDYVYQKGNAGVEPMHRLAIDDKYVPLEFARHLERIGDQRFFGVLHYRGTHSGYTSDPDLRLWPQKPKSNKYDNAVRYLDQNINTSLEILKSRGLLENTLIISSADHGEALGEHGYYGHLHSFFDEESRVPLWIYLPPSMPQRETILAKLRANAGRLVTNIDVIPTLIALLGIDNEVEVRSRTKHLLGQSLMTPVPGDRIVLMQNHNDVSKKYMFGGLGLVREDFKYLIRVEDRDSWEEAYNLTEDPLEKDNVWAQVEACDRREIYDLLQTQRNSSYVFEKFVDQKKIELCEQQSSQ